MKDQLRDMTGAGGRLLGGDCEKRTEMLGGDEKVICEGASVGFQFRLRRDLHVELLDLSDV